VSGPRRYPIIQYTNQHLIFVVLSTLVRRTHFCLTLHYTNSFIPANGQVITKVSEATEEDVDIAVEAAQKAFETTWGLNASGSVRSNLLWKLAQLMERDFDELAALEALDNGILTPLLFQIYRN
jgi:acyl-CoA reductase-like NAD-dependent aldehyde dehydrogenase